jgi:acetyl esterase/lipase
MSRRTPREQMQYAAARLLSHVPDAIKIRLSGEPIVIDGQQLDPQLQLLLRATQGRMPGLIEPTIAAGRERYRRQTDVFRGPTTPVGAVREIEVAGAAGPLRARHYAPADDPSPFVTVYFHGGGYVIGDLDTHDEPCRMLCRHARTHLVSVAYRLAPEHPFPAAVDDARAAFAWTRRQATTFGVEATRVAIGGDSAGATLAAVVAAMAAPSPAPLAQLLIYPSADVAASWRSRELFGEGFYLSNHDLKGFLHAYLPDADALCRDPRVSPLRFFEPQLQVDRPAAPTALIAIAGFDALRDEGEAYAGVLQDAGGRVRVLRFPSLGHGFIHMTGVAPAARDAMLAIAREWRALVDERQPS